MKAIKLNKRLLNKHPADILIEFGAVDLNQGFPEHVYFSKEDYQTLKKNLIKKAKKELKGYSNHYIKYAVGVELLQFGPNESLASAIKPGFALIDMDAIENEKHSNS